MTPPYQASLKYQAVGAYRLGSPIKVIAGVLDLPLRAVYRWIRRFEAKGHCDRTKGSGGLRRTSKRADRYLDDIVKENRFASSPQLLTSWGQAVSTATVKRRAIYIVCLVFSYLMNILTNLMSRSVCRVSHKKVIWVIPGKN